MATMPIRRRIVRQPVEEVEEVEAEEAEALEAEEAEDVEEAEEDELEEEEAPAPTKRQPVVATRKVAVPPTPKAAPAKAVAAPVTKPAAAPAKVAVPVKKAAPAPVADEEEVVKPTKVSSVNETVLGQVITVVMDALENGQAVLVTKTGEGKFTISQASAQAVAKSTGKRLVGQAYYNEVCTPEYLEFDKEWSSLTANEKIARAKKEKVTWTESVDPRINLINLTEAYRNAHGIEKYKPEYQTRKAREAVQNGG